MGVLAQAGVELLDVEQVVIRGRLTLGVLVDAVASLSGMDSARLAEDLLPGVRIAGAATFVEEALSPDTQALVY